MISLHLATSIMCISLITSFSCVSASRFFWVPVVLCWAGRDAEGSVWVGGKLMRRDQEWAAIPAKAFPWQFMFWKMWVLGNLRLFLPIHCSIMEQGNGGGLIEEMFCLSYCPGSSSRVGNISSAADGWQECEQMVGSSWLPTICSHCEHLEDAFIELLGPLQLHVTTPCLSGPPFAPQLQPVPGNFLGFLWQSLPRLFSWGGPDRCHTAVIRGSLELFPSLPMWLPRPAWSCWCCWKSSTRPTAVFSSRHCHLCPSVLMATSCLAGWDVVTLKAWVSPGIVELSLAPPSQWHNLLSLCSLFLHGLLVFFQQASCPAHAEQETLRWVVCNPHFFGKQLNSSRSKGGGWRKNRF